MVKKSVSFMADGKPVHFKAKVHVAKKKAPCSEANIGDRITRKTKNGRTITLERVRGHGKKRNLCWKIVANKKTRSS